MASKYLNQFKKDDISIEHYDGCPAFLEMTGAGFTSALYNSVLRAYRISGSYFCNKQGDYLTLYSDQQEIGQLVVQEYMKDKEKVLNLYNRWLENFQLMWGFYYDKFEENLKKLSNEELLKWSAELTDLYKHKVSMPGFIDGFMFYA